MDTVFLALRVIVSLAAVLGVIWYIQRRVTKGRGFRRGSNPIAVVGRQGVGGKASVAVVEVDGKRFLLGVTEQAVTILHTSDAPVAPAEEFAKALEAEGGTDAITTAKPSPLAGSLLSAETWRRAFASLRP